MPLRDIVIAALSRPAGRVVEVPVRDIVSTVLQEQGYASPAEVQSLRDELKSLQGLVEGLGKRVKECESRVVELQDTVSDLQKNWASTVPNSTHDSEGD